MKKILFLATVLAMLASCADESFVGENIAPTSKDVGAIAFTTSSNAVTRAEGPAAAGLLNNNFVVFGYKTVNSTPSTVFDNYQVNWVTNTAGTTESNSADWEYVSYKNLPFGTTTTSGGTLNNDGVAANASGSSTNITQSIKYWDFSASSYDFFAYSLGAGVTESSTTTWAKASALSNSTYTLEGTKAQLGTCYISKKNHLVPSVSATEVELEFRSFLSQIQLKFYETIPGYSVKEVKFYPSSAGPSETTPYLYASATAFPTGGKYTITFDENGKAQLTFDTSASSKTYDSNIAFSSTLTNYEGAEYKEASGNYLGRASNDATSTDLITMLPNPGIDEALNLKMDFTLVSRDGTGEVINCTGATAVIPAAYATWKPNYKYTYIFKISDNTNVQIGTITGLYPITLDAVVNESEDGVQETITTVSTPSITTYAKSTMVTANNEYLTNANIYIIVNNGTNITAGTDAKLYTAAITLESTPEPRPAVQGITEATVANALAKGGSVVDSNGATLAVTPATGLSDISSIAAEDAPYGHAITIDGVKFTPTTAGDYVFEYSSPEVTYGEAGAKEFNATLPGALTSVTALTKEQANAYNAKLSGAIAAGAILTAAQATAVNTALSKSYSEGDEISLADANSYNATLTNSKSAGGTLTEEEANNYNATLPGAVIASDVKTAAGKHYKVIKVI